MVDERRIVYVDVYYNYRVRERRYEASVRFYLPADGEYLPDIFIDENTDFAGRLLTYEWGHPATDREGYLVESKAKIEKEIEHLRRVVEQNVLASVKVPEPEHYEYVI